MLWELVRCALQGLTLWWYDHRDVPREQVVTTAMNALWVGFELAGRGERRSPEFDAHDGRANSQRLSRRV
jgi:hypothetical protein